MSCLHVLEDRIPWFGRLNGYEQLTRYLPLATPRRLFAARPGLLPRVRGKWHSLRHGLEPAPQAQVDALRRFASSLGRHPGAVGHVLYGEHFLPYLKSMSTQCLDRTVVTFHQPYGQWTAQGMADLARVRHSIFLFTPKSGTFDTRMSHAPKTILHGVDTSFFAPGDAPVPARLLYSGVHLRNLAMLERVIERLLRRDTGLWIDMLVPLTQRKQDAFSRLARHERLAWHAGLDEFQLRDLYRRSTAMMLPMQDSGANTAVVEALACGLPVVTTDVGGIRDYGGGSVCPVVANDDDDAMVCKLLQLVGDMGYRAAVAHSAREFAVSRLDWQLVARHHLDVYATLAPAADFE